MVNFHRARKNATASAILSRVTERLYKRDSVFVNMPRMLDFTGKTLVRKNIFPSVTLS